MLAKSLFRHRLVFNIVEVQVSYADRRVDHSSFLRVADRSSRKDEPRIFIEQHLGAVHRAELQPSNLNGCTGCGK